MAKNDILNGTILWLKAMSKKPTTAKQGLAVDVALKEALDLITRGKLDGDRSVGDRAAEKILDQASKDLAEIEKAAAERSKSAKKNAKK